MIVQDDIPSIPTSSVSRSKLSFESKYYLIRECIMIFLVKQYLVFINSLVSNCSSLIYYEDTKILNHKLLPIFLTFLCLFVNFLTATAVGTIDVVIDDNR